jgi:tetratricopeptide (TPR) repeat protein
MPSSLNNVIPFAINADFFNDIAAKSLERYNYSKALRFFQRAVDLEPHNPQHFFNKAGVLARLDKYEESNELLHHVLEKMDDKAAETHYYLACNYTNLDQFQLAEKHALAYLEQDPVGVYSEEAHELLEYLGTELNHSPLNPYGPEDQEDQDEKSILHDEARDLLEKGSFGQAEKILLKLIKDYPDFLAASNNLALCYYYKGEFEKAQETIQSVLEVDPANIHALCNLAVLYYQFEEEERLSELLAGLKKVIPLQYDQAYKLGITLGVLGEHEAAYHIFKQMSAYAWQFDFQLLHYCAVAAYNRGMYKEAEKYWKMVLREDLGSPVAKHYLDLLTMKEVKTKEIPYYYQLPMEQQRAKKYKNNKEFLSQEVEHDPFVRSSFLWALRHGDRETKLQVLQAFEWLGDEEVVEALLQFVVSPDQDEDLKKIAGFVLKTLGFAVTGAEITKLTAKEKGWHKVMHMIESKLPLEIREEAQAIWTRFMEINNESLPIIRKPEAWVATLEWIASKDSKALKIIAEKYSVSTKTILKHTETIQESSAMGTTNVTDPED